MLACVPDVENSEEGKRLRFAAPVFRLAFSVRAIGILERQILRYLKWA
jgi:hypothetical protein